MRTIEYCVMKWAGLGFRLIRVNGHHPGAKKCPENEDPYRWSKKPEEDGFTNPDVPGTTPEAAIAWVEKGGFLGVLVPEGAVVIDLDQPEGLTWFESEYAAHPERFGPVFKTKHGYHAWFRLPAEVHLNGGASYLTISGFKVTQRVGLKNYVLMPPSEDKELVTPDADFRDLPMLPVELWPADVSPVTPLPARAEFEWQGVDAPIDRECRHALERALGRLQTMVEGERHDTILRSFTLVGGFIAAGRIRHDHPIIQKMIETAVASGSSNARQTALDAINHGMLSPIPLDPLTPAPASSGLTSATPGVHPPTPATGPTATTPTPASAALPGPQFIVVNQEFLTFLLDVVPVLEAICQVDHVYQMRGEQALVRITSDGSLIRYDSVDTKVSLLSRLVREAGYEWGRVDPKGKINPCDTPTDKLKQVLIKLEEFAQPLDLLVHSPALFLQDFRPVRPGYQTSGELCIYASLPKPLPEMTLQEALLVIEDLTVDMMFKTEADRTNFIAAALMFILLFAIEGLRPYADVEAAQSESGKTVTTKLASAALASEDIAYPINPTEKDTHGTDRKLDNEEIMKELHAAVMEGKLLIPFDNFDEFTGTRGLEKTVTARQYSGRILGRSQLYKARYNPGFIVNGIKSHKKPRSWIRRGFRICLEPKATLQGRTWRHLGLENLLENDAGGIRTRWQAALVTLVKHWIAAGMPRWTGTPLSSFEEWSLTIGGILESAGFRDFLGNEQQKWLNADEEIEARTLLLQTLYEDLGERTFVVKDVLDRQRIIRTAFHEAGIPSETLIKTWDPTNVGLALHKIEGGFTTVGLMLESAGKNRRGGTQYRVCRGSAEGMEIQPSAACDPPGMRTAEGAEGYPQLHTWEEERV